MQERMRPPGEKLHKVMARLGVGSRRACEALVAQGRVRVDGQTAGIAERIDAATARIELDGRLLSTAPRTRYLALHKPPGWVTTMRDPQGRPTVRDLVCDAGDRVFPVGRLDVDAEGLLLLTNDGELAHSLTHPRYEVSRTYLVTVRSAPSAQALTALREGVKLHDGLTAPAGVELLRHDGGVSVLKMRIHEGRNRQVKRMCLAVGHPVVRLKRIQVGPIRLGNLPVGRWRDLSASEVVALKRAPTMPGGRRQRSHRQSP